MILLTIKVPNIKYIKLHAKKRIRKTQYLVESQVYLASTSLLLSPQSSLQQCFLWSDETLLPASAAQYDVLDPVTGVMTFSINRTCRDQHITEYETMTFKTFATMADSLHHKWIRELEKETGPLAKRWKYLPSQLRDSIIQDNMTFPWFILWYC